MSIVFPLINFAPRLIRYASTATMNVKFAARGPSKLAYHEHGIPWRVVCLQTAQIPEPEGNEVLIRMLAAPVNQTDLSIIEGKYPAQIKPPATPGIEGIGEVIKTGPEVTKFSKGDRVVPVDYHLGTWRTHLVVPQDKVYKVPIQLGTIEGATLSSNPCAAYRMLKDFVDLEPGDTVIHNEPTCSAGQFIIQLCNAWGINTVNVLRDRSEMDEMKYFLTTLGATQVLTEEDLKKSDVFKSGKLRRPSLALDCLGGESAWNLVRQLEHGGTLVAYTDVCKHPVMIPTSALVFKDIHVRGFWLSDWMKKNSHSTEFMEMFQELVEMFIDKTLKLPPHEVIGYRYYQDALMKSVDVKGRSEKKYIINFESD